MPSAGAELPAKVQPEESSAVRGFTVELGPLFVGNLTEVGARSALGFQGRAGLLFPWGAASITGFDTFGDNPGEQSEATTNSTLKAWAVAGEVRIEPRYLRPLSFELALGWGSLTASPMADSLVGVVGNPGLHTSVGIGLRWWHGPFVFGVNTSLKSFAHVHYFDREFGAGPSGLGFLWTLGLFIGGRAPPAEQ